MFPARAATLLLFLIAFPGRLPASPAHPRILVKDADRDAILNKIATVDWARKTFDSMKTTVDPYVNRHVSDPEWILSRYQMHWKYGLHATNHYYAGGFVTNFTGNAFYPTVRVGNLRAGTNDAGVSYFTPPLDKVPPYAENGLLFLNIGAGTDYEWNEPGNIRGTVNLSINKLALTSAFLFWLTRQEKYARFASDVLMLACEGIAPLTHLNGNGGGGIVTSQTIDDSTSYASILPVIYDFTYDYLVENHGRLQTTVRPASGPAFTYVLGTNASVQKAFLNFINNFLAYGGSANNWNAVESVSLVYCSLALDDPQLSASNMAFFTTRNAPQFAPIWKMVSNNFNDDMIWNEPPAYNNYPLMFLLPACAAADRNGFSIFATFPKLATAAIGLDQVQYPNALYPSYGDAHDRAAYHNATVELSLAEAIRIGNQTAVDRLVRVLVSQMANGYGRTGASDLFGVTHLSKSVSQLPAVSLGSEPSPTANVDYATFYALRNGMDPRFGLMAAAFASGGTNLKYDHCHAKGLNLELYGRGFVQGCDSGSAEAYEMVVNYEYYNRPAGANGVVVNGNSQPLNKDRAVKNGYMSYWVNSPALMGIEPAPETLPVSPSHSFVDLFCNDGTNGLPGSTANITNTPHVAAQRRLTGIVRTSTTTGFYVDVFRSKWLSGDAAIPGNTDTSEKYHDYLYHNVGWDGARSLTFADAQGASLPLSSSTIPDTNGITPGWRGPGFQWLTEKEKISATSNVVRGTFDFAPAAMDAWIVGNENREVVRTSAPLSALVPSSLKTAQTMEGSMPCLVLRQTGEAWMRPFIVVYEPFDYGKPSIERVRRFEGVSWSNDFVGIAIESKPINADLTGRVERIFNATNFATNYVLSNEGFSFQGTYAVWAENASGFLYAYVGNGSKVAKIGSHKIQLAGSSNGSAHLYRKAGRFFFTSGSSVQVVLRQPNASGGAYSNLTLYYGVSGILQEASSPSAVGDASGDEGLVSGTLPAGREVPLYVGPKGNAGKSVATTLVISVNGQVATGSRLTLWRGDRLSLAISDSFGARPASFTLRKDGEIVPASSFAFEATSARTFTAAVTGLSNLEGGAFEATVVNDLGLSTVFPFSIRFQEAGGRAQCSPNPFSPRIGPARFQLPVEGGDADVTVRIGTLGGSLVLERTVASKGGAVNLEWDGRDSLGRTVPAGVYVARFRTMKDGRSVESVTKVVVGN